MKKFSNKTQGVILSITGYVMILVAALDYLFGWKMQFAPVGIIGIAISVTGLYFGRK